MTSFFRDHLDTSAARFAPVERSVTRNRIRDFFKT
jgi:hypothetical protein